MLLNSECQGINLTFPTNLGLPSYDYLLMELAYLGDCLGSLNKLLSR